MTKKFKIIYSLILAALTVLLAFVMYYFGNTLSINRKASAKLDREIIQLKADYDKKDSEKKLLERQKNELAKQINENAAISKEIEASIKQIDQTKANIETAKTKITELEKETQEKKDALSKLEKITKSTFGKKLSLGAGLYYCPSDLSEGRYTISGNDTLLVYAKTNQLIISEDLSRLEGNSFTFDLEKGQRVKIISDSQEE